MPIRFNSKSLFLICLLGPAGEAQQISWTNVGSRFTNKTVWALMVTKENVVFAGTWGDGIFRSENRGVSWEKSSTGLAHPWITSFLSLKDGATLLAGTWGGGVYRSQDNGLTWTQSSSGLSSLDVECLAGGLGDTVFAGTYDNGVCRSYDGGLTWVRTTTSLGSLSITAIRSLLVDSHGNLFAGTDYLGIFKSTNKGSTWTHAVEGLPYTGVSCFALDDSGTIYAGTHLHGIFTSTNGGQNWRAVNEGLPMYLNTLPYAYIISLATFTEQVYAASAYYGVYARKRNGGQWVPQNGGLSTLLLRSIAIGPDGVVYVGTDGNGVFRSLVPVTNVDSFLEKTTFSFACYPNPFNPTVNLSFSLSASSYIRLRILTILGQEIAVLFSGTLPSGTHQIHWNASNLSTGTYIAALSVNQETIVRKILFLR